MNCDISALFYTRLSLSIFLLNLLRRLRGGKGEGEALALALAFFPRETKSERRKDAKTKTASNERSLGCQKKLSSGVRWLIL